MASEKNKDKIELWKIWIKVLLIVTCFCCFFQSKIDWFDEERIIDDWVLMGFLVGNDFIPHLPDMHISHNALPLLYKAYVEVLPSLGGKLSNAFEM